MRLRYVVTIILILFVTFAFAKDLTYKTIDVPGSAYTRFWGINDGGQMVGDYNDAGGIHHSFLLSNDTFTEITVPGAIVTNARGINNSGDIVGLFNDDTGSHGFWLTHDGTLNVIDINGPGSTEPRNINDRNQIVGNYYDSDGVQHGFVLSQGQVTTVDVLNETISADPPGSLVGFNINNAGAVVGPLADGQSFLLSNGVVMLFNMMGSSATVANAISDSGAIVGLYAFEPGFGHGFLLEQGSITAVDFPGAAITRPMGINARRQIVGFYRAVYGGAAHGFVAQ